MKKNKLIFGGIAILVLSVFLIAGCSTQNNDAMVEKSDSMMEEKDAMVEDDVMEEKEEAMMEEKDEMMVDDSYQGEILAGSVTPYIAFNKADYDKAVSENKIVLLYFYAEWCPSCKTEQIQTFAAFNELEREDVVGFRVNYRDSGVDSFEEELAKEHGVTYQHTKVILQNGERVLKAPNSWKKEKYLEEINKVS